MDFEDTILFSSAMWDKNSEDPKVKTGFVFEPHMNYLYEESFND